MTIILTAFKGLLTSEPMEIPNHRPPLDHYTRVTKPTNLKMDMDSFNPFESMTDRKLRWTFTGQWKYLNLSHRAAIYELDNNCLFS